MWATTMEIAMSRLTVFQQHLRWLADAVSLVVITDIMNINIMYDLCGCNWAEICIVAATISQWIHGAMVATSDVTTVAEIVAAPYILPCRKWRRWWRQTNRLPKVKVKVTFSNTLEHAAHARQHPWRHFRFRFALGVIVSMSIDPPPILHLASSEQWCWSGGRGILTELSLCYSIV